MASDDASQAPALESFFTFVARAARVPHAGVALSAASYFSSLAARSRAGEGEAGEGPLPRAPVLGACVETHGPALVSSLLSGVVSGALREDALCAVGDVLAFWNAPFRGRVEWVLPVEPLVVRGIHGDGAPPQWREEIKEVLGCLARGPDPVRPGVAGCDRAAVDAYRRMVQDLARAAGHGA